MLSVLFHFETEELDSAAARDKAYVKIRELLLRGCAPSDIPAKHPARPFMKVWDQLSPLEAPETTLLLLNDRRIVVPAEHRAGILRLLHMSHAGISKTLQMARQALLLAHDLRGHQERHLQLRALSEVAAFGRQAAAHATQHTDGPDDAFGHGPSSSSRA